MFKCVKKIEVWGDSVLKGVIYDEQRQKYTRLDTNNSILDLNRLGFDIKNNARFGMTATKAKNLMMGALEKGVDCQAAIIEFGGNDCDYRWNEVAADPDGNHLPNTRLESFKECITDMVNALRRHGITPVLVNLPPIDAEKYFAWISRGLSKENILKWLGDIQRIYRHHECYSLAIMKLAQSLSCDLIDVREPFLLAKNYSRFLCEDGIHPNSEGHHIMNRAFVEYASNNFSGMLSV